MSNLSTILAKFEGKDVYICLQDDVADFTDDQTLRLKLSSAELSADIRVPADLLSVKEITDAFSIYIGSNLVIGWNIKNLFSYILGKTGFLLKLTGAIYDLRIIEHYNGVEASPPEDFASAKERLRAMSKQDSWKILKNINSSIYNPLIARIIPEIETTGIVDKRIKKLVHACYDVSGQINGRMRCSKAFKLGYNPHVMTPEEKGFYRLPAFDHVLMYLDFKHMEVSVLQWLSGDPVLKQIIDSNEDVYVGIWELLTTLKGKPEYRKKAKGTFLPVAFGLGPDTLAEKIGVSPATALKLIQRINQKFSVAMQWLQHQQVIDANGLGHDIFGRARNFTDGNYKVRNFVVQSPAATICMNRLVKLSEAIEGKAKIGFHLHDGYGLFVPVANCKIVKQLAIQALEAEDNLCPGLKLKVRCYIGENLTMLEEEDASNS